MIHRVASVLVSVFLLGAEAVSAAEAVRVFPSNVLREARQPQVAVDPAGVVYLVAGSGNAMYCAVSHDGGKRFERVLPGGLDSVPRSGSHSPAGGRRSR